MANILENGQVSPISAAHLSPKNQTQKKQNKKTYRRCHELHGVAIVVDRGDHWVRDRGLIVHVVVQIHVVAGLGKFVVVRKGSMTGRALRAAIGHDDIARRQRRRRRCRRFGFQRRGKTSRRRHSRATIGHNGIIRRRRG